MKGKFGFQIGTGVTSIFMIFIVLCLTIFAILSYTAADADLKLTNKHVSYIENYYGAYSKLNDELYNIDYVVCEMLQDDTESNDLYMIMNALQSEISQDVNLQLENNGDIIEAAIKTPINDKQELVMEFTIDTTNINERCKVTKCYVYSENGDFIQEETLPDMWGG